MNENTAIDPESFVMPRVVGPTAMEVHEELTGPNSVNNPHQDGSATDMQARQIAKDRFEDAKAHALPTEGLLEADAELEALERKRSEIEAKKRREIGHVAAFQNLLTKRDALKARLKFADDEFGQICTEQDQLSFIEENIGERNSQTSNWRELLVRYQTLAGIREAWAHYPKWRAEFVKQIEAANGEIATFAIEHKIDPPKEELVKAITLGTLACGEFFELDGEVHVVEDKDNQVPAAMRIATRQRDARSRHLLRDSIVKRVIDQTKRVFASRN